MNHHYMVPVQYAQRYSRFSMHKMRFINTHTLLWRAANPYGEEAASYHIPPS